MAKNGSFGTLFVKNLGLVFVVPSFFVFFAFLYNPYSMQSFYEVGGKSFPFHFTMLFCIMLVTLAISRLIYAAVSLAAKFDNIHNVIWCVLEIFAVASFTALYTTLFYGAEETYFQSLSKCLRNTYTILVYPYVFFWLKAGIERARSHEPDDSSLLKLYDEHHRLKLTIDPKAILYFQAESNYYKVYYVEGERIKEFILRNSMKSLEEPAGKHGIIRCHRSYYVNPAHIKVLRKDKDGFIYADMDREGAKPIPVSKSYFASLSKLL